MAGTKDKEQPALKKRNDAYTGFLAISFLAMTGATVLLFLEYQNYEGKAPPKAPVIDVPGAQLKTLPGTGGPPKEAPKPPPEEPAPMPMPDKDKDKDKEKDNTSLPRIPVGVPPLLPPIETVEIARPNELIVIPPIVRIQSIKPEATVEIPVIQIPELPAALPAPTLEPLKVPQLEPIISVIEPNLSDAPPLPPKRFDPPK